MPGQSAQHDRRLDGPALEIRGGRQPAQPGVLEIAPQRVVERLGQAAVSEPGVERPPADVVDQLAQLGGVIVGDRRAKTPPASGSLMVIATPFLGR